MGDLNMEGVNQYFIAEDIICVADVACIPLKTRHTLHSGIRVGWHNVLSLDLDLGDRHHRHTTLQGQMKLTSGLLALQIGLLY